MEGVVEKRAVAKFIRVSPTKVRQVLRIIRGKNVEEAEVLLRLASRPVARTVSKVLKSAVSNATSGERKVSRSDLYVKAAFADGATILKRFLPRAQGRATPILKHSCHITILVAGRPGAPKEGAGAAATEKKAVVKKERKRGPLSRSLLPGRSR
jgi:large subunit ribosomal protein L22